MAERPLELQRVDETNWRTYRDVRLAMLLDAPRSFGSTYAGEAAFTEERWLERVRGAGRTWLALRGDLPVGSVTTIRFAAQSEDETCLVGMWVAGHARGNGVGEALVETASADARQQGCSRLTLDVAHDNSPARKLYERMGFRPTGRQGVLRHDEGVTEFEMFRPL